MALYKWNVQARFLLGPSGVGKTFRCLAEVRAALRQSSEGPPLLFLAPKQATFQLERQLLSAPDLHGYTRLQILSFERLAEFVVEELSSAPPQLLSEEGRLMVLRALLSRHRGDLGLFHATSRLRGFAQQLSSSIRELQRAQVSARHLAELATKIGPANRLDSKLRDLATMQEAYVRWLGEHQLQDRDGLLDLAVAVLRVAPVASTDGKQWSAVNERRCFVGTVTDRTPIRDGPIHIGGLWLDGFAELSSQEIDLLITLLPFCDCATLAFNLDRTSEENDSWLSTWWVVGQTFRQVRQRLEGCTGVKISLEWLGRDQCRHRFAQNPVLRHLEKHWSEPSLLEGGHLESETTGQWSNGAALSRSIRVVECANPEAEAMLAAREVLRFVRSGGRFREAAVLVRDLESYQSPIRRVFTSYQIPFFLDRREPVGHHPLAELTRSALQTVAFQWEGDNWFNALKTGLVHENETEIDRLENEALARGWSGRAWHDPFRVPDDMNLEHWAEALRKRLIGPFRKLEQTLGASPSGKSVAEALRAFWDEVKVREQLGRWSAESANHVHATFWEQMQEWLENIALAFSVERLPLREWLPIIEAGLSNQTVGVIPPSLDQVVIGAVDRSRNPELRLAIVLGVNESVFPSCFTAPVLLSESDRERLAELKVRLGRSVRDRLSQEQYLGYVACTRARERLVLTLASRDENDNALNPSPFIAHLQRLFPGLEPEPASVIRALTDPEHVSDLLPKVLEGSFLSGSRKRALDPVLRLPAFAGMIDRLEQVRAVEKDERVSPALVEQLYGKVLATSVSRLENFAACPFKFFVSSGLRAEERKYLELDAREQGTFQHDVLALFHGELASEGKRWRDLKPREARERIGKIASRLIAESRSGLLTADDQSLFTASSLTLALQDFIETIIGWMGQYEFDPRAVELAFGREGNPLPARRLRLDGSHELLFRGQIDRVDLWTKAGERDALCIVVDYKSSSKRLDSVLLAHGVQLQLAAYLNVLRRLPEAATLFRVDQLVPAGMFYVNLRVRYTSGRTRREVLGTANDTRKLAYRHTGRFDSQIVRKLDRREVSRGDQFNYSFNQGGELSKASREALDSATFNAVLEGVERQLGRMGRAIFDGVAIVDPYRKGRESACDRCDYHAICRIDPWVHVYRVLRKRKEPEDKA